MRTEQSPRFPALGRPRYLNRIEYLPLGVLAGCCLLLIFSVDIMPNTTNDTIAYLNHGYDLSGDGVIAHGYRQLGYPLFLRFAYELSLVLNLDPLFLAAFLQRLVLAAGIFAAVFVLRLWAIPVLAVAATPMVMSLANRLYPEGLLAPLGLAFGVLAVALFRLPQSNKKAVTFQAGFCVLAAIYAFMAVTKLQSASTGLILACLLYLRAASDSNGGHLRPNLKSFVSPRLRWASLGFAVATATVALFVVTASIENGREFGVARPVIRLERSVWAGAWQLVFEANTDNRARPELTEYYDGGSLFPYLRKVECRKKPGCKNLSQTEQSDALKNRSIAMLRAASYSPASARLGGFVATFYGGRMDDQGRPIRRAMLNSRKAKRDGPTTQLRNYVVSDIGVDGFLDEYNRGKVPAKIDGLGFPNFLEYHPRDVQRALFIPLLALLAIGVWRRQTRLFVISALAGFVMFAAAVGYAFVDVWRYVLPMWMIIIVVGLAAGQDFARSRLPRRS